MLCPTCGFNNANDVTVCRSCGTRLTVATPLPNLLAPGTKLQGGAYTVGKPLGQGGFGITYLGSDVRLKRPVAIKEFFPVGCGRQSSTVVPAGDWTVATYADAKRRFLEEGRTLAQFNHPGIVRVYTTFEENNTAYIVMEYLRGKNLAGVLQERGGRLNEREAVGYIEKVGEALEVVHGVNLLHRDIKPENVIVTDDGRVVMVDFGTAKEYAAGKTQTHSVTLTPGYAPLEQYAQKAQRGTFTDVYALSATLYHLLTGEAPVAATDRVAGVTLPAVRQLNSQVSERVARAVMQGLEMEVGKRPPSARAFLDMLKAPTGPSSWDWRSGQKAYNWSEWLTQAGQPQNRHQAEEALRQGHLVQWLEHLGDQQSASIARQAHSLSDLIGQPPPPEPELPPARTTLTLRGHSGAVVSVAFSPDGKTVASGSGDQTVKLWDVQVGTLQRTLTGHSGAVRSVAFSPDGKTLVSGSGDQTVKLWDTQTGRLQRTLTGHNGAVNAVAFSPDGKTVASGSDDRTVKLWDIQTGTLLRTLGSRWWGLVKAHGNHVVSVAFSPDGKMVASGSRDQMVKLWDAQTGTLQWWAKWPNTYVTAVAFSPNGKMVATGIGDNTVRLLEVGMEWKERVLRRHSGLVFSVAFSPDGRILASGSADKTVRLWNVQIGTEKWALRGHSSCVNSVAFSPDGKTLASGSDDGTVKLWDAQTEPPPPPPSSGNCFLATAAFGSPLAPEVETLRTFRDMVLKPHPIGREAVRLYERVSPSLARWVKRCPIARWLVRTFLIAPLVRWVKWTVRPYVEERGRLFQ